MTAKIAASISVHVTTAIRKVLMPILPDWYLPNGRINAGEIRMEAASASCERWTIWFAGLVIVSVAAELALAICEPSYILFLKLSVPADTGVGIGIIGEVAFGMWDSRIQTELRRRSNEKLGAAEKKAAEANERAARLEKEAAEARRETEFLRRRVSRRWPDESKMAPILKLAPAKVEIRYLSEDVDSVVLATFFFPEIFARAGWLVTKIAPISLDAVLDRVALSSQESASSWWDFEAGQVSPEPFVAQRLGSGETLPPEIVVVPVDALHGALRAGFRIPVEISRIAHLLNLPSDEVRLYVFPR